MAFYWLVESIGTYSVLVVAEVVFYWLVECIGTGSVIVVTKGRFIGSLNLLVQVAS